MDIRWEKFSRGRAALDLLAEEDKDECVYTVRTYRTREGKDLFDSWVDTLRDVKAKGAIDRRVFRIASSGNFGDHKFCTDGVWELRIDVGAGYRVYYAIIETHVVLLLAGGDKSSQSSDIKRAAKSLRDWEERNDER
jgi:putative addiction module killer protein